MSISTGNAGRFSLSILFLGGVASLQGCCYNDYYVQQPGCGPVVAAAPAAVRYGSICEAPDRGATVISRAPAPAPAAGTSRSRVVVSEPGGRLASRPGWRRYDPENLATTEVEGAVDNTVIR